MQVCFPFPVQQLQGRSPRQLGTSGGSLACPRGEREPRGRPHPGMPAGWSGPGYPPHRRTLRFGAAGASCSSPQTPGGRVAVGDGARRCTGTCGVSTIDSLASGRPAAQSWRPSLAS
eukprot:14663986-Alexandrium_andersonii.AAC.1